MIYNKNGEMFFYEDRMFIIGEEVFASESDYAGLLGRITEIRTGEDRDTENEGPDIYCNFQPPIKMKNKKNIATYARVGSYEQLESPIDIILDQARRGEIQTVLVSSLERLCEDQVRREALIKELSDCGVKIITSFDEKTKERCCAIYNRYSTDDFERLAEVRGKLITYCTETLGVTDYVLFEEVGSCLEKRDVFDDMVTRIENGEFTDLLVNHIDRIFKPAYDKTHFIELADRIQSKAVIHILN